ncbi:MAG: monovalent cation/H(+) antiporter subunit G [Planctomycetota bacterium]
MDRALDVATAVLLGLGAFVTLSSAIGVWRMPDFFTRLHPAGKNDSLAQLLMLLGLLLQAPNLQVGLKLVMASAFLLLTTPTSTYATARAAYLDGRVPWTRPPDAPEEGQA